MSAQPAVADLRLSGSIFYGLHRPSLCELRLFLQANGVQEAAPSPYVEILHALGKRYESEHVRTLGDYLDLSAGDEDERLRRTRQPSKPARR